MDNQPPNNNQNQSVESFGTQAQPQAKPPAQQPVQPPAQPSAKTPASPQAKPGAPKPPVRKVLSKEELIQREKVRNKKLLLGCGGLFGCGTILLLVLIFVFVGAAGSGSSSLATALEINQASLINTLVLIVNLFFGLGALVAFIVSIGGIFKALMARKDDTVTKRKGYVMSASAFGIFIILIGLWVTAWYYLNSQQVPQDTKPTGLITIPAETINLTAPVEVTFDASNLPYDKTVFDILSYQWDFGDGQSGPGSAVETHKYEQKGDGRYDVKLTLTFRNKNNGEESLESIEHTVTIADEKVTAIIKADKTEGSAPLTVTFDASDSVDPDGSIESYSWEVDGQGFEEGQSTFTHTFDQIGAYNVKLRVTNTNGDFALAEQKIEVSAGNEPLAFIEIVNPEKGNYFVNKQYTFDGAKSSSPTGVIQGYEWDFGDGTSKNRTRTAQHVFTNEGSYRITLTVTDEEKVTATQELTLKVVAAPSSPQAIMITNPQKAEVGDNFIEGLIPFEVNFDGSTSTDPDDDIVDYQWDFDGDGVYDAAGETTNHVFKAVGNYNVSLVVIDSAGYEDKEVLLVKALSRGLEVSVVADPISGVVPLTVEFDGTGSTYADGQIVSYEWDFGDGAPKRSDIGEVTYKYTKIGNFTATVKVKTNDNKEEVANVLVSVRQVPLQSCFEPSKTTGDAPLRIIFNPGCSTGTVAKYRWAFGDGEISSEHKPTHIFANPGTYEVVLEVSDAQNVIDSSSQFITVTGDLTNLTYGT